MAPAETESNAPGENGVKSNPEMIEETDISAVAPSSVSNVQTTMGKAEHAVPAEKALVASIYNPVVDMDSGAGKEKVMGSLQEEMPADTPPGSKIKSIIVRHHNGQEFMLPFALCQTQKAMEDLVKLSYEDDEEAKKEIDEGKYELLTTGGAKVLPRFWDILVEPGWEVTIRLGSQQGPGGNAPYDSDDSDDSSNEGDESKDKKEIFETSYTAKVKYTVATYVNEYRDELVYLYSQSYDGPVSLDNKARQFPILEEIQTIVLPRSRIWRGRVNKTPKGKPKLGLGDMVGKTSLRIHSPFLLNALKSIISYSSKAPSGENTDNSIDGEFPHPYEDLFHHKQELSDYKKETSGPRANHTPEYNAECDSHIDFLLEYLDQEPNVRIKALEAMWAKKIPTTTFAGFWLLMKPGSDVYVEEDGQLNAYVVDSVSGGVDYLSPIQWSVSVQGYSVRVWYLKYDGKVIGRGSKFIHVSVFDNERDILSLPIFPTRFQDNIDGGARRKYLIERGHKAFRLAKGPAYLEYTGLGLKAGWKQRPSQYSQSRVVVEHESQPWKKEEFGAMYTWLWSDGEKVPGERAIGERARAPCCKCSKCRNIDTAAQKYISALFSDYDNINPKEVNEISEHQYMICLSHMFGFILKDRTYDILDVGRLADVKIVENAIDRLVMRPETNKDTIKAIVKTYTDSSQPGHFNADFIQGKGEGQIFLLHGPPGTGKTLTAESVAEYTRRPLLSITAADLGHEPMELEKNLLLFLKNASNWDAIVLLDEADVYLERRSAHDLRRNSIVSIFLRAMEYFQGILFLTTNRVGHFDEAFMSRIHVSIGYELLDEDARGKIWDNLFRKLKEDHKNGGPEIIYEYDAKQYVKKDPGVKNLQWNGREIRNAFQTAVALALFDSKIAREKGASDEDSIPEIKEKHLAQVVNMSTAFKKYITATHEGIEDADMAYKLGSRHDKLGNEIGGGTR
ncbi:hypothetical protein E0Z10_g5584 [Xylaria hypoxylon]|uniref:AAA+ ATPase domain-containing protein n=1 Tax=Xylaria hypoxylon TaxID=37992 RepID=A0A4Z0Z3H2_9PEZI|nr:hypothetical protein E0Z10_g5584 [Xylaria hypoxylon]